MRIFIALLLLCGFAFCIFGFLATFEPPGFLPWRIGYFFVGLLCLAGVAAVLNSDRQTPG